MKKRPFLDSEGRIFGVISVVDIVAVLVVAVLAVMLVSRFSSAPGSHYDSTGDKETNLDARITYVVCLTGLRETTVSAIQVGDELYDPGTGNSIGTVASLRQEPYVQLISTTDGRVVEMETQGYINIYYTIEGKGMVVDGHCYLNGTTELLYNSSIGFVTPYVTTSGRITSFTCEVGA